jgi:hypothetical protein
VLAGLGVDAFEGPAVGVECQRKLGIGVERLVTGFPGADRAMVFVQSTLLPEHVIPLTQRPLASIAG